MPKKGFGVRDKNLGGRVSPPGKGESATKEIGVKAPRNEKGDAAAAGKGNAAKKGDSLPRQNGGTAGGPQKRILERKKGEWGA